MILEHKPEFLVFATAQSMRNTTITSVIIGTLDQLDNVDQARPMMPMSIAYTKTLRHLRNPAVVFFEHKRSLLTGAAQRAKIRNKIRDREWSLPKPPQG
jgi:hypothetical protein